MINGVALMTKHIYCEAGVGDSFRKPDKISNLFAAIVISV